MPPEIFLKIGVKWGISRVPGDILNINIINDILHDHAMQMQKQRWTLVPQPKIMSNEYGGKNQLNTEMGPKAPMWGRSLPHVN